MFNYASKVYLCYVSFLLKRFEAEHPEKVVLENLESTVESEKSIMAKQMSISDIAEDVLHNYDKVIKF